jgi:signal transduction histidine kinase
MNVQTILTALQRSYIFPLAVLVAAALLAINEIGYRQSNDAAEDAEVAQQKRAQINFLMQYMLDAETGQRGYLLTGSTRYLEPYNTGMARVAGVLDRLRKLYVDDSKQLGEFALLSRAVSKKMSEMEITLRLRNTAVTPEQWRAVIETNIGQDYMDDIRQQANSLITAATAERTSSMQRIHRSLDVSRIGITLAALSGLLAFHLYLRTAQRLNSATERQNQALAKEKALLAAQVRERTLTLTELATHLQTVQEKERAHLARELHDELGALLTAAKLDVARVKSKIPSTTPELQARMEHLTSTLNAGIALKRRIIEDLRPSSLSNLGLIPALEILATEFQERSGLAVVTNFEAVEVNDDSGLTIFRMVQEALTNVAKYAEATEVTITLHSYANHVELVITDNGRGFDVPSRVGSSYGLKGMLHRIQALNGSLTIQSREGAGTRLAAIIPKTARPESPPALDVAPFAA